MDLVYLKEVSQCLLLVLSSVANISVLLWVIGLLDLLVGNKASVLRIKFLKGLLNSFESLPIKLAKDHVVEFNDIEDSIPVSIKTAEDRLDVLLLKVQLEVGHCLFEFLILESATVVSVKGLEESLQTEETSLSSRDALVSDSVQHVHLVLGLLLLRLVLLFNLLP